MHNDFHNARTFESTFNPSRTHICTLCVLFYIFLLFHFQMPGNLLKEKNLHELLTETSKIDQFSKITRETMCCLVASLITVEHFYS